MSVLLSSIDEGVALLTLNRPDRLNAWTNGMARALRSSVRAAVDDPSVRVIVITGAGRGFCAGADMKALDDMAGGASYEMLAHEAEGGRSGDFRGSFSWLLSVPKPVIAAVNGPAAGVGFVLMCFADLRFAAAGAKITTSFGRLGLPAEHGVAWLLPRIVGAGRAADLLFSSRVVMAEEAFEIGLVNRVFPETSLVSETLDYARTMAAAISPASLRVMKQQLWASESLEAAWQESDAQMLSMIRSADFAEGVAAFQEKRPPRFAPLAPDNQA